MTKRDDFRQTPKSGALLLGPQFLAGPGRAYICAARPTPSRRDPCSLPSRSSATGRSVSPWWAADGSRPTTSRPSSASTTAPSWSGSATSIPRRSNGRRRGRGRRASRTLEALLAGTDADIVILATPSGLHADQAIRVAAAGAPRDDREADGHALAGRQADGARLRRGRGAPVRGQAEPAQRHAAAAQAGGREEAVRPDLHGEHQRLLEPAPVLLRQRGMARHVGVRRRRLHEPGEPLRRPARLAHRAGRERPGLHRDARPEYPGRGHRRGEHPLAHGRAGLA